MQGQKPCQHVSLRRRIGMSFFCQMGRQGLLQSQSQSESLSPWALATMRPMVSLVTCINPPSLCVSAHIHIDFILLGKHCSPYLKRSLAESTNEGKIGHVATSCECTTVGPRHQDLGEAFLLHVACGQGMGDRFVLNAGASL